MKRAGAKIIITYHAIDIAKMVTKVREKPCSNLGKSEKAFEEAKRYMPGGVNSPVRSYRSVGS